MPERTPQEIDSDWYRVICQHVIDTIEAANSQNNTAPDEEASDRIVDCFRKLRWVCQDLKAPPVQIQVWTGEGLPPDHLAGDDWEVEYPCSLSADETEDGQAYFFYTPEGHRHLDIYTQVDRLLIDIDGTDGAWFHDGQDGTSLLKSLRWRLDSYEANIRHRMLDEPGVLFRLDVSVLADDLSDFSDRVAAWIDSPSERRAKIRVAGLVDRLWRRLRDGEIDSIDWDAQDRKLLEEVWSCVLWAQRAIESGRTHAIKPYEVGLQDLPIRELACQAAAISKAAQAISSESIGVKRTRRKRGKSIDKQMNEIFKTEGYMVLDKTAKWWSQRLKCADSTIKEADTWKVIVTARKELQGEREEVAEDDVQELPFQLSSGRSG